MEEQGALIGNHTVNKQTAPSSMTMSQTSFQFLQITFLNPTNDARLVIIVV